MESDYDAVAVSETWLNPDYPDKYITIPNYSLIRMDRPTRGGGVAMYIKSEFKFKVLTSTISDNGVEQLWLLVNISNEKIGLGVIYKPPNVHVQYLSDVTDCLEQMYLETKSIVLMGDVNVNLLRQSADSRLFTSIISDFSLKQVVSKPTRITELSESLIDIICISKNLNFHYCDTYDLNNKTDHLLVFVSLKIEGNKPKSKLFWYRNYHDFDLNKFARDAVRIQWDIINNIDDLNLRTECFNQAILSLFDVHAPLSVIKTKPNYQPYITYNLKMMIKLKNKSYNKYLKTKTVADRQYYVNIRNYVKEAVKREKEAYMRHLLERNKQNSKALWKNLRNWGVCTKSKGGSLPMHLTAPDAINNYFLNVAGPSNIDIDTLTYFSESKLNDTNFTFHAITNEDIFKSFNGIKSEAYGIDGINTKMIGIVLPYCIDTVRHVFNESINTGIFPDVWKTADIIPLPKVTNPATFNDLRPISILPTFSKMFEKIIGWQVTDYLEENQILPAVQSGFRQKHSTGSALLKVVDDIATAFDNSFSTVLVLLDQSKAFDLVHFDLLLAKMSYIGFGHSTLLWFYNYLNGRKQRVKIHNEICSQLLPTTSGVPQGSVLAPILFSIFTFDLPKAVKYSQLHLYADDMQLYKTCSDINAATSITLMNTDLDNVFHWCSNNGLRLNPTKTVAICIGPDRQKNTICNENILVNGMTIEWVSSVKNLGVYMDSSLCFNEHVNHVFQLGFYRLKSLYHLKYNLSENIKLKLIKSLIYPHIDYCSMVYYYFLPNYNQQKIQRLQNACIRFVCNVPYRNHVTPYINRLSEPKICNRMMYISLIFLYKVIISKLPSYLHSLLIRRSDIHNVNVRINYFTIPQHTTRKYEGSFSYVAPSLLNKVLMEINLPYPQFVRHVKALTNHVNI